MKNRSYKTVKNELDRVFSLYIRRRDTTEQNGERFGVCISCKKHIKYEQGDAGHFINRRHLSLRWNEKNTNFQCRNCNRFDEGNNIGYIAGMINRYGQSIIMELQLKKNSISKLNTWELEQLIIHYKNETKKLK